MLKRLIALCCLFAAAACGGRGDEISPDTAFVPGREPTGLLVFGPAASRYDTFLGVTAPRSVGAMQLTWVRLDAGGAPMQATSANQVALVKLPCGPFDFPGDGGCDMRGVSRHVLQVQPGDYQLTGIEMTTVLAGSTTRRTTRLTDNAGLILRVGAGEVVYGGDFTIEVIAFPARILRINHDVEGARAAVAALPRIAPGPLTVRTPVPRAEFLRREQNRDQDPGRDPTGKPAALRS